MILGRSIVRLLKTKDKQKILKIAREKLTRYRKGNKDFNNCGLFMTIKGRLS